MNGVNEELRRRWVLHTFALGGAALGLHANLTIFSKLIPFNVPKIHRAPVGHNTNQQTGFDTCHSLGIPNIENKASQTHTRITAL